MLEFFTVNFIALLQHIKILLIKSVLICDYIVPSRPLHQNNLQFINQRRGADLLPPFFHSYIPIMCIQIIVLMLVVFCDWFFLLYCFSEP